MQQRHEGHAPQCRQTPWNPAKALQHHPLRINISTPAFQAVRQSQPAAAARGGHGAGDRFGGEVRAHARLRARPSASDSARDAASAPRTPARTNSARRAGWWRSRHRPRAPRTAASQRRHRPGRFTARHQRHDAESEPQIPVRPHPGQTPRSSTPPRQPRSPPLTTSAAKLVRGTWSCRGRRRGGWRRAREAAAPGGPRQRQLHPHQHQDRERHPTRCTVPPNSRGATGPPPAAAGSDDASSPDRGTPA